MTQYIKESEIAGNRDRLIRYSIYFAALMGSGYWASELKSVVPCLLVSISWLIIFTYQYRPYAFLFFFFVVIPVGSSLMIPTGGHSRLPGWRRQSSNNLSDIAYALKDYRNEHGTFPPAYLTDENGKLIHSWRVLILPYLDGGDFVYDQYDFGEPWDGPNNIKLLDHMPYVFQNDAALDKWQNEELEKPYAVTNYFAVIGPNTVWPGEATTSLPDMTDGENNTLIVIEDASQCVLWLEPRDLEYQQALNLLSTNNPEEYCVYQTEQESIQVYLGRQGVFADGSTRYFPFGITRETWSKMLNVNDGEKWSGDDLEPTTDPLEEIKRIRSENRGRVLLVLFLTVFPLPWVFINPRSESRSQRQRKAEPS